MKTKINATSIARDYQRRNIKADYEHAVTQGLLLVWVVCNNYVCELRLGANKSELKSGDICINSECAYINTYSAQEIADDIINNSDLKSNASVDYINNFPMPLT